MIRAFCVTCVFFLLLVTSCTQKVVCPAYQSAFIYDKDALRKKYSYFSEDSTPKVYASAAKKNKYLIGVPVSYKKKARSLQTVAMVPVIPVVPDSLKEGYKEEGIDMDIEGVERNVNDSTAVIRIDTLATPAQDSVYVISKEREIRILKYNAMKRTYFVDTVGFNTEQDNYMWYLRDVLVLPDARLAKLQSGKKEEEATAGKGEKAAKGGFFKNLFKKKQKEPAAEPDSVQLLVEEPIDYGYDEFDGKVKDSTEVEPVQQLVQPQKSKGTSNKKKKEKKKKETPPVKKEDEDQGDGF